ncbi:MAG: DsbA family protein [Ectothiorhodospiraceae bacterium]
MTTAGDQATGVPVSLYLDYACPFCFVASERLERLAQRFDLDILWRFIEGHPETPTAGAPLPADSNERSETLVTMIHEDGLPWQPPAFRTNSRLALLLAQTVQLYRRERFSALHQALFRAHFGQGRNLGDSETVRSVAAEQGVDDLVDTAWNTAEPIQVFLSHVEAAQELAITSLPTLVVSERVFPGAVSMDLLEQSLTQHYGAEG